jgi:hypothetical protein
MALCPESETSFADLMRRGLEGVIPTFPPRSDEGAEGLSLTRRGVTEFATRNVRDFGGLGFTRVFDPIAES